MNLKSITIINQDSGYLMIDIANAYVKKGFKVTLITGRIVMRNTPLHKSVKLLKIISYSRKTYLSRVFTWACGTLQILFYIWLKASIESLLVVSNPPFAPLLKLLYRNKVDVLVFDVYPDALSEINMISEKHIVFKIWSTLYSKSLQKSNRIMTISYGMKALIQKYVPDKSIDVIPLWSDTDFLKPIPRNENKFIFKYHLQDKFIVLYSGNLGVSSNLDMILDLAKRTIDSDIVYLIIGEGARKKYFSERIQEEKIKNCMMLPWQDASEINFSLASAHISIVTSTMKGTSLSLPSKLFSIIAVGSPVLCFSTKGSELESVIENFRFGECFLPESIDQALSYIMKLKFNSEEYLKFTANALKASKFFTPDNALMICEKSLP